MSLPTTVDGVLGRLREIQAELPARDGVAVFNGMYLTVTERIASTIAEATFRSPDAMTDLDVRFANLWLTAPPAAPCPRRGDPSSPPARPDGSRCSTPWPG